jgi:hypothetical protein
VYNALEFSEEAPEMHAECHEPHRPEALIDVGDRTKMVEPDGFPRLRS